MSIQNISNTNMSSMIQALNQVAQQAKNTPINNSNSNVNFSDFLKNSLENVNLSQKQADELSKRVASGDNSVNLHEVMIAMQTASLSLQETVQVRNKIMTAYQEIMNMQV